MENSTPIPKTSQELREEMTRLEEELSKALEVENATLGSKYHVGEGIVYRYYSTIYIPIKVEDGNLIVYKVYSNAETIEEELHLSFVDNYIPSAEVIDLKESALTLSDGYELLYVDGKFKITTTLN